MPLSKEELWDKMREPVDKNCSNCKFYARQIPLFKPEEFRLNKCVSCDRLFLHDHEDRQVYGKWEWVESKDKEDE